MPNYILQFAHHIIHQLIHTTVSRLFQHNIRSFVKVAYDSRQAGLVSVQLYKQHALDELTHTSVTRSRYCKSASPSQIKERFICLFLYSCLRLAETVLGSVNDVCQPIFQVKPSTNMRTCTKLITGVVKWCVYLMPARSRLQDKSLSLLK